MSVEAALHVSISDGVGHWEHIRAVEIVQETAELSCHIDDDDDDDDSDDDNDDEDSDDDSDDEDSDDVSDDEDSDDTKMMRMINMMMVMMMILMMVMMMMMIDRSTYRWTCVRKTS